MRLRKIKHAIISATIVAIALPMAARAGVYDDVAAWWHLDYGASGTITTPSDIRDQRDWYNHATHAASSIHGTPAWTTTGVPEFGPAGGRTYGGRAIDLGIGGSSGYSVNDLSVTGDATVFVRFKWDDTLSDLSASTLYFNGFGHSANQGWMLRLNGANANPQLYYGTGHTSTAGWTTTSGQWCDLAMVLDENGANDTVTFYRNTEGGAFEQVSQTMDWFGGEVNSTETRVGYEGTNYRHFGGQIETVAIWDRALDVNEVHAAIGSPDSLWSMGIDNHNNLDFRNESGSLPTTYTLGQPWGDLSRAVTQYGVSEFEVQFEATAEQAALPFVYHLDTDGVRSPGLPLTASINGNFLGTKNVTTNQDYEWYIEAGQLTTGTNTLRLEYTGPSISHGDGGTYACWDWMEMAGSWQLGYDNGTQTEFITEGGAPDDFYVTDPEWQHLERAVTDSDPSIRLHFNLSDELANSPDDYYFVYTSEVISQGGGYHPLDISVNGTLLKSFPASPDHTKFSVSILSSLLNPGDNVIELLKGNIGSGGWAQFDFHRFEVFLIPEPTTFALAALGFACTVGLLGRRRRRGR